MMKKLPLLLFIVLFAMCKSKKTTTDTAITETKKEVKKEHRKIYYTEQTRNDFRSVTEKVQKQFLKDYNAHEEGFAILFFTQGFSGEEIVVKNDGSTLYESTVITDKTTGLAKNMRINSWVETEIYDKGTKKTIYINPNKASKHKFIYVMKGNLEEDQPYKITFSDKLRPAK